MPAGSHGLILFIKNEKTKKEEEKKNQNDAQAQVGNVVLLVAAVEKAASVPPLGRMHEYAILLHFINCHQWNFYNNLELKWDPHPIPQLIV